MPAYRINCSEEAARWQGGDEYVEEWAKLPKCPDCDRPMRPHGTRAEHWPATVVRAGGGFCSTHYSERSKKRTLPGDRKIDLPPELPKTAADTWSAEERSAALLVSDVALRNVGPCSAVNSTLEILDMLGLLNEEREVSSVDLLDPKGAAANRY